MLAFEIVKTSSYPHLRIMPDGLILPLLIEVGAAGLSEVNRLFRAWIRLGKQSKVLRESGATPSASSEREKDVELSRIMGQEMFAGARIRDWLVLHGFFSDLEMVDSVGCVTVVLRKEVSTALGDSMEYIGPLDYGAIGEEVARRFSRASNVAPKSGGVAVMATSSAVSEKDRISTFVELLGDRGGASVAVPLSSISEILVPSVGKVALTSLHVLSLGGSDVAPAAKPKKNEGE